MLCCAVNRLPRCSEKLCCLLETGEVSEGWGKQGAGVCSSPKQLSPQAEGYLVDSEHEYLSVLSAASA